MTRKPPPDVAVVGFSLTKTSTIISVSVDDVDDVVVDACRLKLE